MLRWLDPGRRVWEGEDILEETEDEIARRGGRGWGAVAIAGACAGVVSWTVRTLPTNHVSRSRLKTNENDEPKPDASVFVSCFEQATFPFDVIKTRVQATARCPHPTGLMGKSSAPIIPNPYTSTWSTARNSWKMGGWKVFYAGLQPTLLRAVVSLGSLDHINFFVGDLF